MRAIVGAGLMFFGGVTVYGGVTGRLAPMLAALFYPSALKAHDTSGGGIGGIQTPFGFPLGQLPGRLIDPAGILGIGK